MSIRVKFLCLMSFVVIFLSTNVFGSASEEKEKKVPEPKLILLDLGAKEYMRILGGPPETVTMHSGLVVLDPGKSVGKHSTKNYEEVACHIGGWRRNDDHRWTHVAVEGRKHRLLSSTHGA